MLTGRERTLIWIGLRLLVISLGIAIGAGLADAGEVTTKPKSRLPKLTISIYPASGFMPMAGKYHVIATIILLDPDRVVGCPGYVVFWDGSDENKSLRASSCSEGDERETVYRVSIEHDYERPWSGQVEVAMMDLGAEEDPLVIRATTKLWILAGCNRDEDTPEGRCM